MSKDVELKSTLNLPRTDFPMKAELPVREPKTLDWWDQLDLYRRLRQARSGQPPFVLHDGPPYASGPIHLGHALNKILKDFAVKSRTMAGCDARYVPGWDCHGLPIEHRVDRDLGAAKAKMDPLEVRQRCRTFAEEFIDVQRAEFRRLGVLWDRTLDAEEERRGEPSRQAIYRTLDRSYEAEIIRQLGLFFTKDAVYHGVKPVHWCWSCRTALAEAEVEYEQRTDPSVYVKFPVLGLERRVPALAGRRVSLVIWTTTPWTLPANLAVALHPGLVYVAVEVGTETFIVAEGLLEAVRARLGWEEPRVVARFTGAELVGEGQDWIGREATVERPYPALEGIASGNGLLILGEHVTLDAGTGCVHTAPGHGADDFFIGKRYGLEPFNPVDDGGRFIAERVGVDWLGGMFVLEANERIVQDLEQRGLLLHAEPFAHSYPHCWRCNNPVLFRSTPQWFIALDANGLRQKALEQIQASRWIPAFGQERIAQMVADRPDWCISRQRTWGVPIPAVVCERCLAKPGTAFIKDPALFEHLRELFLAEGADAWFGQRTASGTYRRYASREERLARLVPENLACPSCHKRDALQLQDHIVDVWFESGVSHAAVLGLPGLPWPADLYLEGHDQYRGWFQSSLLVAVNDRGRSPYRAVVTHGFTLDGQGRKMSKSLGNVISPLDVTDKRGADILRLWVSMVDFLDDMRLSPEILDRNVEAYRKIRNTFRFLLGNLNGFRPDRDRVPYAAMEEIDRWALQQLEQLRRRLTAAYEQYQYHLVYHGLQQFCGVTLSSFYLDILKDRLYTLAPTDAARLSGQSALQRLASDLCRLMAPVLAFTAEEIWQELELLGGRPAWSDQSVHVQLFPDPLEVTEDKVLLQRWERLVSLREEVQKALEIARKERQIGSSLEAVVILDGPDRELLDFLRSFRDLHDLFITSGVEFAPVVGQAFRSELHPGWTVGVRRAPGSKCERCWHWTTDVGSDGEWPGICARCVKSVRRILSQAGSA